MKIYWSDTFNFFSKLTPLRIFNAAQLLVSFYLTKWTKKVFVFGSPMTVSFEPTTACNLRCPECPSGLRSFTRETGNLKKDFFTRTIDTISNKLIYLIFYFQGEPFINPDFLDMVSYANKKGLYTITSTNGHFLNKTNCEKIIESKLDRIIISIDGLTQSTYSAYRKGGQLQTVIDGSKLLVKTKKERKSITPHIIFQFLVVKPNEHEIADLYNLAEEIGIDEVKLKTAQVYDFKYGNELIPTIDKYSRYQKKADGTYVVKNKLLNNCWKLWHACVFTWNGVVVPCCFDKDASHPLGNLSECSFEKIWKGKAYDSFRSQLIRGRQNIEICKNCTEGCQVWA
ncbi:MAG: radical SAM protein [Saprospiraceae bacterium]|nr:SPASM domain-containing protein [Bacteroidia bacterium]NNL93677.1 radical SAM protein [Saprospiraceae bacterium]